MFRSSSTRYRKSLVAIAVASALASSHAWTAEEADMDSEESIEEIIVTGTRRVGMTADLLVRLEKPRAQMTGKGEGVINEVVFGDIAWVKPIGIKLTADGSRFQLRPVLPAFLSRPGKLLPSVP